MDLNVFIDVANEIINAMIELYNWLIRAINMKNLTNIFNHIYLVPLNHHCQRIILPRNAFCFIVSLYGLKIY